MDKVIAISADNINTNFDWDKCKGKNNIYQKLIESFAEVS